MRPIAPDPGGHRFLAKALAEAGNELAEELYGCSRRLGDLADDEGWTPRLIAAHVLAYEEMVAGYLELILQERDPALDVIDTETMLDDPRSCREDAEYAAMAFARQRQHVQYLLWGLDGRDWERTGRHPYKGVVSVAQLVRELHQHDLEYLWRVRRIKDRAPSRRKA